LFTHPMLIRSSGAIHPDFHIITLGCSSHYVLTEEDRAWLFDPGLSVQLPYMMQRLGEIGIERRSIEYVFLTHLHADRIGAVPTLKKMLPEVKIVASAAMKARLSNPAVLEDLYKTNQELCSKFEVPGQKAPLEYSEFADLMRIDKAIGDADLMRLSPDVGVRAISFPGHTAESMAYFVQPYHYLIADEGMGYYQGRKLAAPGGDFSLKDMLGSLAKFNDVEVAGLCFTAPGVITGNLVRKHFSAIALNCSDMQNECLKAFESGVAEEDIMHSLRELFYSTESGNKILAYNLERSLKGVWDQLQKAREGSKEALLEEPKE
jgi:glyoxylase-like metal-dependent hydrolase (beta-lactamase superfamily II)